MTNHQDPAKHADLTAPSDVCLMLRAHAQQHWLNRQVMPVLSELEDRDSVPEDQVGAALAYLEVLWHEASIRAGETEAAFAKLNAAASSGEQRLHEKVRRYHASVSQLHQAVEDHVTKLVAAPSDMRAHDPAAW
jgi:hypothetical protein